MTRLGFAPATALAIVFLARAASAQGPKNGQNPPAAVPVTGPTHTTTLELNLTVGETRTIPVADISSYLAGSPGIVDIKMNPEKTTFVIAAVRSGTTSLLFLRSNGSETSYTVNVFAKALDQIEKEVNELLVGYTGIRVRRVGNRLFMEGGVSTEADAKRMQLIANLYPGQVESLVVMGSVGKEHETNIRIDFYFVQYDKTSSYGVGVSWPGRIGGTGKLNFSHDLIANATSASATADQLLPALDIAQIRGWAKVLKHSTVITTSGTEATFANGGEQNFPVATGVTSSIQAVKFGTNMTVLPRYDAQTNKLEVKVNANVSDLTPPGGASSIPGRQTADIATLVHLRLGQSIVLSGIRTSSQTHAVTGLPGLSQIPILGLLFGSHQNSVNDIEGAVFIIPSIVESVPRGSHNIVDVAMKEYENYSGNIDPVASYPHAPPAYR
jgi:pilus assembly protein CpaC